MYSQISYENPIWDLTPTELKIAYLSLELTKLEIAEKLNIAENTVGTHLTNVYKKLDISEYDDEVKRSILKLKFGPTIERIVREVNEDYDEYRKKRRKVLSQEKSENIEQIKKVEDSSAQSVMEEPPPSPRQIPRTEIRPQRVRVANRPWIIIAFVAISGCFLFYVLTSIPPLSGIFHPQNLNEQTPEVIQTISPETPILTIANTTETSASSPTIEPSFTATPTIPPTSVPLPIREDFSQQYSDLWWVLGDPILTESIPLVPYSGVLTTRESESATLLIGNTAWTNYVVSFRAASNGLTSNILIGVRVIDLNNMIALDCNIAGNHCTWVIIYKGNRDVLPTESKMMLFYDFILTVEGDTFRAIGKWPDSTESRMSIVLPSQYQGKFSGGGVLIQIKDVGVDYVEINSLP
jgi:DNA-binding CsgD family transcriptional regulator